MAARHGLRLHLHRVPRAREHGERLREALLLHHDVVGVEGGEREDRDPLLGQRLHDRREDPDQIERKRAAHLERAPAALGAHAVGHRLRGAHDRQLGRRADDGVQRRARRARRPRRQRGAGVEPGERELAGEDAEGLAGDAQRSRTPCFQCVSGRSCSSPSTVSVTASRSVKKQIACSIFGHSGHGAT